MHFAIYFVDLASAMPRIPRGQMAGHAYHVLNRGDGGGNQPPFDHELVTLRTCVNRQQLFGREDWQASIAATLGLESTLRRRGRPLKPSEK